MKEITRIHLAKTPFEIETSAKKDLEKYLVEIEKNMQADADAMREIEARMIEILAERGVATSGVITAADVAAIKQTLGGSEEFADDEAIVAPASPVDDNKKLMRDLDNAWVGGVSSGFAAYFNIDVLIVRAIILVLTLITGGAFIFVYVLLWLVVPPAKTAADKLRMRGKPVTLEALKTVSDAGDGRSAAGKAISTILRTLVAIGLVIGAIGTMTTVVAGGVSGFMVANILHSASAQPWLIGLTITAVFGGLMLTALLSVAAYAVGGQHFGKPIRTTLAVLFILGMLTLPLMVIFGTSFESAYSHSYGSKNQSVVAELSQEQLKDVNEVRVDGEAVQSNYNYIYSDTDKLTVRVRYSELVYDNAPEVVFEKEGDKMIVNVKGANFDECSQLPMMAEDVCGMLYTVNIDVIGPIDENSSTDDWGVKLLTEQVQ